jgi:hypothetical protein
LKISGYAWIPNRSTDIGQGKKLRVEEITRRKGREERLDRMEKKAAEENRGESERSVGGTNKRLTERVEQRIK